MSAVQLNKISFCFASKPILHDLQLSISAGQYLVLLGQSGCGKTSLLRMIAGLLHPTDGQILFDGKDVGRIPPRRRDIAYVPQNDGLYPHQAIAKSIGMGIREKLTRHERQQRILQASALVGIDALLDRLPAQLSGGQLRRAALAKAIARQASVRLLDEPLSAVDGPMRYEMQQDLRRLHLASPGVTIHVTHDPAEARQVADQIAVLTPHPQGGASIAQCSPTEELFKSPVSLEVAAMIGLSPLVRHQMVHRQGVWYEQTESTKSGEQAIAISGPVASEGDKAAVAYHAEHEERLHGSPGSLASDWVDPKQNIRVPANKLFWFPEQTQTYT